MTVPILQNHDSSKPPLGFVDVQDGRLCFRFSIPVEQVRIFEIFGNVGVRFTETEYDRAGTCFVIAGEIFEFSAAAR